MVRNYFQTMRLQSLLQAPSQKQQITTGVASTELIQLGSLDFVDLGFQDFDHNLEKLWVLPRVCCHVFFTRNDMRIGTVALH